MKAFCGGAGSGSVSVSPGQEIDITGVPGYTGLTVTGTVKVTKNTVDFNTGKGWYVDFPDTGERVITNPSLAAGVLAVTANIPDGTDECLPGGHSWLYAFDYRTRLGPFLFADTRLLTAGPRAVAAASFSWSWCSRTRARSSLARSVAVV